MWTASARIVVAAAVLNHGRLAGRNLCDAISGLLAAQTVVPLDLLHFQLYFNGGL
jgi:hypothetical protein